MYIITDGNGIVVDTAKTQEEAAEKQRKYAEDYND